MLHQFGTGDCPRCSTKLVHEFDLANDWVLPSDQVGTDQRWICPGCGYARPVTYQVDRPLKPAQTVNSPRGRGYLQ